MLSALLLSLICLPPLHQDTSRANPHRQFDFWVGEWSVQNRFLQPNGSWLEADVTRARITPVCDGQAILEEWAGPYRGTYMNGFSLRAWDPDEQHWNLLLNWTTDGNSSFGTLTGTFRHGRGEFFSGPSSNRTRYSFSDALANTVRWDSAMSTDGGQSWKTDWIMEFTRTRPAQEVTEDELFAIAWNAGGLSPHEEARQLDRLLGLWRGTQTAQGRTREAELQGQLLNKDCLVVNRIRTRGKAEDGWQVKLTVRGFDARAGAWEAWSVSEDDTRLRKAIGTVAEDVVTFVEAGSAPDSQTLEILTWIDDEHLTIEEIQREGDAESVLSTTRLERVDD